MAGYTRNDTGNNIANGNVIDADDLDGEFNAIETAFGAVTGHTHGGTTGDGAPITRVGPAQDVVVSATQVLPKTTNTLDLGSATFKFKDAYVDGIVYVDAINLNGTAITATAAELNALDGITATVTELNYTDGVTSSIQTQLDAKQPLDADLTAIAGLISAADRLPYYTGSGTAALATFSSFGRNLVDDADAAAARTTLALGTMATQAASAVSITGGTITGITDLAVADGGTGVGTLTGIVKGNGTSPFTAAVAGTDYLAPAAIGTTVQAFDTDLSAVAGLASNGLIARTGAGTASARTITAGPRISITNGDGVSGNPTVAVGTLDITTADIQAATLVTASETIAASNNDTTIPTTAAVLAHNITLGTAQTPSGVAVVDFTGIPSWAKRVTVMLSGLSSNGTSPLELRVGTSGGFVATGYDAGASYQTAASTFILSSTGFPLGPNGSMTAAAQHRGVITLHRQTSGNEWIAEGDVFSAGGSSVVSSVGGSISLGGALDRVRVTALNGTDTFDAGTINIAWE